MRNLDPNICKNTTFSKSSPGLREGKVAAKPILSHQLEPLDSDFGHLRTRNYPHLSIFPVFLKLVEIGKIDFSI